MQHIPYRRPQTSQSHTRHAIKACNTSATSSSPCVCSLQTESRKLLPGEFKMYICGLRCAVLHHCTCNKSGTQFTWFLVRQQYSPPEWRVTCKTRQELTFSCIEFPAYQRVSSRRSHLMYPRKKTLAQRHPCSSADESFTLAWFRIRRVDLQWLTRMQTPSGSTV